jgi:hypothetical protein
MWLASPFTRIVVVAGYVLALVSLLLLTYFGGPALSTMLPDHALVAGQTTRVGGPLGQGDDCRDQYEPDDEPAEAAEIYPDMPQQRLVCPEGDEDWIMLQGVSGKVYTIDVTEMSQGLDLSLTLYNKQQEQLAFNDDFPHDDDPHNIRPRIQSWQVPADGQYFIRVRDNVGRGGVGLSYTIVVKSESYGLRPTNIPELCLDRFEPDASPELAQMIMIREVQEDRTFCPDEDEDWVRFFARAGQRYRISVDTNSSPGVDPTIVIMDRDGASMLARSEEGAAATLPSADFEPAVDGFYYAQLTNAGGIGGHFIQYDLIFDVADGEADEDVPEPITPTPDFYPTPEPFPTPDTTPTPTPDVFPTPDTTPTPQDEVPTPEPEFFPTPEPTDPAYPGPDFQEFPTPEPTDPAYPGPDFQEFPTPEPTDPYPGPSGGVPDSMGVLARAANAEASLRSGEVEVITEQQDGTRSVATMRFDLGNDLLLPRLQHITTGGMPGNEASEHVVVGDQAWQRQSENGWISVFDQPSVSEQVKALLPDLSSAGEPYIETLADGNLIALLYYDAQCDADVIVVMDANSGVLRELQRVSRKDGSALTVRYSSWNTLVDIIPPVDY